MHGNMKPTPKKKLMSHFGNELILTGQTELDCISKNKKVVVNFKVGKRVCSV